MFFLTIQTGDRSRTIGSTQLKYLTERLFAYMPVGRYPYDIGSKGMIFRIEIRSEERFVATYTNVVRTRHNHLCAEIIARLELDCQDVSETESLTDIDNE